MSDKINLLLNDVYSVQEVIFSNFSNSLLFSLVNGEKRSLFAESLLSSLSTLESIEFCVTKSHFGDAYTLIRKYRDDVFQYLYIHYQIKNITCCQKDENLDFNKFSNDDWLNFLNNSIKFISVGSEKNEAEKVAEKWVHNAPLTSGDKYTYFGAHIYFENLLNIIDDAKEEENTLKHYLEKVWKETNSILNNYVHGNGSYYVKSNIRKTSNDLNNQINEFNDVIIKIEIIILSVIIMLCRENVRSNDYINYLDLGLTPPEGSQYWVNTQITDFIKTYFDKYVPGLKQFLYDNNKYGMKILDTSH